MITYRRHDWFDKRNRVTKRGIQAKAVGYECRWLHCDENGSPLLFDTEAGRADKLKDLRKRPNNAISKSHAVEPQKTS